MDRHVRNAMDHLLWAEFRLDLRDGRDAVIKAAVRSAYAKRVPDAALDRIERGILEEASAPDEADAIRRRLVEDLISGECADVKGFSRKSAEGWVDRSIRNLSVLHAIYSAYGTDGSPCPEAGRYAASVRPMGEREAVEFLLSGYGPRDAQLGLGSGSRDVLRAAVDAAYHNAASRGSFVRDPGQKDASEKAREDASQLIQDAILGLCERPTVNFDEWHTRLCRNVRDGFSEIRDKNGKPAFTYGNAQKWVNVALRNLYVLSSVYEKYVPHSEFVQQIGQTILRMAPHLHTAVDTYTLLSAQDRGVAVPKKDEERSASKANRLPWSKWDDERTYMKFQRDLKKALGRQSRIEWETRAWIDANRETAREMNKRARAMVEERARQEGSEKAKK